MAVPGIAAVHVATDDDRIAEAARAFGAQVILTSQDCRNGTERCAEAVDRAGIEADLIVNLQGDAPLTPPGFVTALVTALAAHPSAALGTPVIRSDATALARMRSDRSAGRVGATTAVTDRHGRALYFSKEVLPFQPTREPEARRTTDGRGAAVFHHVGLYAYTPSALAAYARLSPGPLEQAEGLEQLRFLEHGLEVLCVEVEAAGQSFWELNHPGDVDRIEAALRLRGRGPN